MDFASLLKGFHNLLRWVVVLGGIYALIALIRGLTSQARYGRSEESAGRFFVSMLDLQVVVGVILYLISPFVKNAMQAGMGEVMSNTALRSILVEHVVLMVLAAIAAHIGLATARAATTDRARFTRALIWYLVAGLLIVLGTPWGRPLIPWMT